MKYRGAAYERAIEELKALRALMKLRGQKSDARNLYLDKMKGIAKEFSISEKTVYRDMLKKIPGLRKTRNDAGKIRSNISHGTKEKAEELMQAGQTKEAVKKRLKLSQKKMERISKMEHGKGKTKTGASKFGNEAKELFEKLFDFNLIAPGRGIAMKHNGVSFIVTREDLKDIILILANAYNRFCFAENKKLKLDRTQLRNAIMEHLIEDQMRFARESADYKLVEALTRMIDRLKEDTVLPDDFEAIMKVCQQLKPDISREDLIGLIKKISTEER